MSVDRETLMAYADGELGPADCILVEAAIAADPELARQVEAHRALRSALGSHFAPVLDMPVPERLKAPLERPLTIIDLAMERTKRAEKIKKPRPRLSMPYWAMGGAMAASLVAGLLIGGQLGGGGQFENRGGQLVAGGVLDRTLTTQLASAQSENASVRILLSFKTDEGRYCRGFESGATAGIACRQDDKWAIMRTQAGAPGGGMEYRQAGSASAGIMAAAQEMASGGALDAGAERAARDADWRE